MKTCIICREVRSDFGDEHVIPDSINGYYHIYSVCNRCNNKMGSEVDNKLTNHKFIEFQRQILGIRGKRGTVPDPLKGTYSLVEDPNQQIVLKLDSNGKYEGKLKPSMSQIVAGKFTVVIDKKDEAIKDHIINRFLREQGITRESVKIEETAGTKERPQLQAKLEIDIEKFKMAMLKIAYEFTVDQSPEYFDDAEVILLSKILFDVDYNQLKEKVQFIGSGFNSDILQPFAHLLDVDNNNHYLILMDSQQLGLLCFVNLFNALSLGIVMTKSTGFIQDKIRVLKNDITLRRVNIYDLAQLVDATFSAEFYNFCYWLPKQQELIDEFKRNELEPNFSFYTVNDKTPLFNKKGSVVYDDVSEKLAQKQLLQIEKGDDINSMTTEFILDEELFVKHLPIGKLYRVLSVSVSRLRIGKI